MASRAGGALAERPPVRRTAALLSRVLRTPAQDVTGPVTDVAALAAGALLVCSSCAGALWLVRWRVAYVHLACD